MLAVGAQYIHKALNVTDPPSVVSGAQEGVIFYSVGSQDDTAGFIELQGKPFRMLEVDLSGRYDHYDTYGGSATPKVGLKFTPIDMFAIRGTWGRGFRAPSIAESGTAGLAFGQGNTNDPVLCPGGVANVKGTFNALCAYPAVGVAAANPRSEGRRIGERHFRLHFRAHEDVQRLGGLVLHQAHERHHLGVLGRQFLHRRHRARARAAGEAAGVHRHHRAASRVRRARSACRHPWVIPPYTLIPYINAGETKTSGYDVDLRSQFDIGDFGSLKAEINYTYIQQYELVTSGADCSIWRELMGRRRFRATPAIRGSGPWHRLTWDYGACHEHDLRELPELVLHHRPDDRRQHVLGGAARPVAVRVWIRDQFGRDELSRRSGTRTAPCSTSRPSTGMAHTR